LKLSVVVPVFNEVNSLPIILNRVVKAIAQVDKEIIVVDDCSTDGTTAWLRQTIGDKIMTATFGHDGAVCIGNSIPGLPSATIRAIFHERNRGKGAALRTGFRAATGDVLVIQDADLEYDPTDWEQFWPLFANDIADVVYGSRFHGHPHRSLLSSLYRPPPDLDTV